jgi:hypothetical protein
MIQLPELLIVLGVLALVGTYLLILHYLLSHADKTEK